MSEFFFSVGSVILDDIVLLDGTTHMGLLGGGATHAVMGMRVWAERVGLAAIIGRNFPEDLREQMSRYFDLSGLQVLEIDTPRAWQVYEPDGHRVDVFRTSEQEFNNNPPRVEAMPEAYRGAAGVHLQCKAPYPLQAWIAELRKSGCRVILWEPWDIFCIAENWEAVKALLPQVDVFSPGLREARRLTGLDDPVEIAQHLLRAGARGVILRMGAQGSLAARAGGRVLHIPAVPVEKIVDMTGAGNAYNGGFVVGLAETGSWLQAGRMAAVAASFSLEQYGALAPLQDLRSRAEQRLRDLSRENPRRAVFDRLAAGWDQKPGPPGLEAKLQRIAAAGRLQPEDSGSKHPTVLDLGAGSGVLLPAILQYQPGRVLSVDLSPEMLRVLSRKFSHQWEVKALAADGSRLPLATGSVDRIFCHAILPHFEDKPAALRELYRVTAAGGRLVISHAAGREQINAIHRQAEDEALHQDELPDMDALVEMLEGAGWQVSETADEADFFMVVASKGG